MKPPSQAGRHCHTTGNLLEDAINQRLTELCARMAGAGMDAALLLHHRDVLYYAGTVRPAALFVSPRGAVLFVRRGLEYARQEATVARVEPMRGFASIAQAAAEFGLTGGVVGTEMDLVPARLTQRLTEALAATEPAAGPAWSATVTQPPTAWSAAVTQPPTAWGAWVLADISPLVLAQRAIKDEAEIAATRHAAAVADAGHSVVPRAARPGVSELALAAEVEAAMRRAGHDGFQPLRHPEGRGAGVFLMSGEHLTVRGGHGLVVTGAGLGPAMPYGPSRRVLRPGDLVVLDIGSAYAGYTGDESRTFVVGQATEEQRALFSVARAVQDAVLEALRPGVDGAALYAAAEAVVAEGAPPHFAPGSLALPGFVGHGMGLEMDEPPILWPRDQARLQAGMVLAIEIEVSAPDRGTMVKLEDTVVVHPGGYELLTATPRELIECG